MAGTDIDVVKAVFAAFAARDVEGMVALADPALEFNAVTSEEVGRSEPYRGHEGLRQYFRDAAMVWEELRLTPQEFRAAGDMVLVTGRVSARSPSRTVSGTAGWIWRVKDGRITYGRVFANAEEALAALEEGSG